MKTRSIVAMLAILPVWLPMLFAAGPWQPAHGASESHTRAAAVTVDDLSGAVPRTGKESKKMESPGDVSSQAILTLRRAAPGKLYVALAPAWIQQGGRWLFAGEQRQDLSQAARQKDLYPASADANADIAAALRQAAATRRHVLIDFGANWCFDCHVLDDAFHSAEIAPELNRNFVVVHVDVGEFDKNLPLAEKYGVPLKRGIPALAVLDSHGKLLFSQKQGEFEKARSLAPEDILAFLNKWKPSTR